MKLIKSFATILYFFMSVSGFAATAADPEPLGMLKGLSNEMVGQLNKNLGNLKNNNKLVDALVYKILVPHFDLTAMSRSVAGVYWQQAPAAVQQQFVKEFTRNVVRTYSAALQSYDGEIVKFYPIRGDVGVKVRVSSEIILKNGPAIQIQYGLQQQGGGWVIYDFSVDGISIVKNYNSQFAGTLRQIGLSGLVDQLQKRNVGK